MPEVVGHLLEGCARELGLTDEELFSIARIAPRRYYVWDVAKRSGGKRTICHPALELKIVHEYFLENILHNLPVHAAATAYAKGSSIKRNAQAHTGSRVILKIDFLNFFNSLKVKGWLKYVSAHFPQWSDADIKFSSMILFWGAGSYDPKCLAVGAPTSPLLSNAMLHEVDERLSRYAGFHGLVYTRYADDITFSSRGFLDQDAVLTEVRASLRAAKYSNLRLNTKKTNLVTRRFSRKVTGLTLTPDHRISIGRKRKRDISAAVHSLLHGRLAEKEYDRVRGLISFAQDIEPSYAMMLRRKYGRELIDNFLTSDIGRRLI